jgi:hypothetical protein
MAKKKSNILKGTVAAKNEAVSFQGRHLPNR